MAIPGARLWGAGEGPSCHGSKGPSQGVARNCHLAVSGVGRGTLGALGAEPCGPEAFSALAT